MFKNKYIKYFITNKNNRTKLEKMTKILNIEFMLYNDLINIKNNIKLVDNDSGKLLGDYYFNDGLKYANNLNKDLVLFNEKSNPPICKVIDYEEFIYKKFYSEIIKNDFILNKKYKNLNYKSEKIVEIKPKIQIEDLKTKINKALEILKKNEKVSFRINCKENELENSKSIISTIKNLTLNQMKIIEDLKISDLEETEVDQEPIYQLKIVYSSLDNLEKQQLDLDKEKIDDLVENYFQKHENDSKNISNVDLNKEIEDIIKSEKNKLNWKDNQNYNLDEENKEDDLLIDNHYKNMPKIKLKTKKKNLLEFGNASKKKNNMEILFDNKIKQKYGNFIENINIKEEQIKFKNDLEKETENLINSTNNLDLILKSLEK